ncbi:hypothetical protein ACX0G9_12945 [Flavitalea flava]
MPVSLETDFALSALPAHLREGATVYLLDPANERERAKILRENKDQLKRLADYKPYFAVEPGGMSH